MNRGWRRIREALGIELDEVEDSANCESAMKDLHILR